MRFHHTFVRYPALLDSSVVLQGVSASYCPSYTCIGGQYQYTSLTLTSATPAAKLVTSGKRRVWICESQGKERSLATLRNELNWKVHAENNPFLQCLGNENTTFSSTSNSQNIESSVFLVKSILVLLNKCIFHYFYQLS